MKKLLVSILMLGLMFNVSCTSKNDTDSDQETTELTDPALDVEGADAAADMDAPAGEASTDDFAEDEEIIADTGEEVSLDGEDLPDQALAPESTGAEGEEVVLSDDAASTSTDVAASDSVVTDDGSLSDMSMEGSTDSSAESYTDTSTETSTDTSYSDTSSTDVAATTDTSSSMDSGYTEPKPMISVKKIKDVPFNQGGMLLNTVYLARDGDDVSSISNKIYGSDRSAELLSANPHLNRGVKVGDKLYYNSSKRPQDAERILTFYEDNGIPAQSYMSKSGDNIRVVSKNLLGHKDSWKEVWATNLAVESKGDLPEGTELRYWSDSGSAMPMANVPPPAPQQDLMEPAMQEPVAQNDAAALPQDDFSMPDDMNVGGTVAAEPPPPPPPPAPQASKQVASADKDMTFMLSAGGLLLVGVGIILAVMRRSRSRKISMNTNTQI